MYVRTREQSDLGLVPPIQGSASSYLSEPQPVAKADCFNYEAGEREKSFCQTGPCQDGHLVTDVIRHPRGLLIADFGVAWHGVKTATRTEKALSEWMAAARADLHSIVLHIYGYTDCVGEEKHNGVLRANRAQAVYELLDRALQSRVNFIGAAKAGEYVADNKTREGRAKNRSVIIELLRLPDEVIYIRDTPPPVCPRPDCAPPPPPKKVTPKPDQKKWKIVGKYAWKGKRRRLGKKGYFEIFAEPEVEFVGAVNATDKEFATVAVKWENGKLRGGEFETLSNSWFAPELKVEWDKEKGVTVSFKKQIKLLGDLFQVKPHLQLSDEFLKTEFIIAPFKVPITLAGQKVELQVEPKAIIIVKLDLWQILMDRLKDKLKDFFGDLLRSWLSNLGRGFLASLAGKILAGLLGGVLAHVFGSSPPSTPVTAPPDDVNGKSRAQALVATSTTSAAILQKWADTHRHAFAKAFADTMVELCREKWKDRLAGLRTLTLDGYKALPAATASDAELLRWATTPRALQTISIDLPSDNFVTRFRWYELMLMFAVAAWILRRITKAEVDQAKALALRHASVAGMAAAVQFVNHRIVADTFEFVDEHGKTQTANGTQRWDTVGALVRSSGLKDAEIRRRLEELGVKQLPGLVRIA